MIVVSVGNVYRHYYNANGLRLLIESDESQLHKAFASYLDPFVVGASDVVDFTVNMSRGEVDAPPLGSACIFDGQILPGVAAQLFGREGDSWLLVPNHLSIRFDAAGTRAWINVSDTCDKQLLAYTAIHVIDAALAASGQYLVHGAALALPDHDADSLLVFAQSGSGKTTTALALALGGFALMTDDAIVLQPNGFHGQDGAFAWGLPRALKVHRVTAQLLPAVAPLLQGDWDENDEQVLTAATLSRIAATAKTKPLKIAAIAVLGQRTEADHALRPLHKATALKLLTEDNVRRTPHGVSPTQAARFRALSSLIGATPTFELRVGARLPELGREILKVLGQARGG